MKSKLNKLCSSLFFVSTFLAYTPLVHANIFQRFGELNYDNPASLTKVKKAQIVVGNSYVHNSLDFSGCIRNRCGEVSGLASQNLPFGRIAARISKNFVVAVDVTRPFAVHFEYPGISLASPTVFRSVLNSVDVSPKVAVSLADNLAFGVGLNAQEYQYDLTSFRTFNNVTGLSNNQGSDWGVGWNMGVLYTIIPSLTLGLSHYSSVSHTLRGTSSFAGILSTDNTLSLTLPSTTTFSITKVFSPKWTGITTVNYIHWNVFDILPIQNTAIPTRPIFIFAQDTWRVAAGVQYKLNSKITLSSFGVYDEPPVSSEYRSLVVPSQIIYGLSGGLKYQITSELSADFNYVHNFRTRAPINNDTAFIYGNLFVSADTYNVRLTYNI